VHGDRFILRDQSASRTLAGGMVIDPQGPARGRARPERLDALQALEEEDAATALAALLPLSPGGVDLDAFARARNLRAEEAQAVFDAQDMVTLPDAAGPLGLAHNHWQPLRQALLDAVGLWHRDKADELGPNEAAIRTRLPGPPAVGVLRGVVLELLGEGRLARTGMVLHLPDHKPQPSEQDETLWQKMLPLFDDASLRPPRVRELAEEFEMDVAATEAFLRRMVRFGRLLPVAANRFFPPQTVRALADIANALADEADDGTFDARAYKDRSGIGRNVTIEVLEYFDQAGFTRRAGNERTILRPAQEVFGAPATDGA
jgi:selenocysteine-specific elongation factor